MMPRIVRSVLLFALLPAAGSLAAQTPAPRPTPRLAAPMFQTATLDIVAAFQQHWRVSLEPLVFGRLSFALAGSYTTTPDNDFEQPLRAVAVPAFRPQIPCDFNYCPPQATDYRAWSLDLAARWYPGILSLGGRQQTVAAYVGEFVGYHERRMAWQSSYCPYCVTPQNPPNPPMPPDTVPQPPPNPGPLPPTLRFRNVAHGFEPGAEIGVRVAAARHFVVDIGGRFRLATLDDPFSSVRPGGVDSRLVVAVGVGW